MKIKNIIFVVVCMIANFFSWYYSTVFCSIYQNNCVIVSYNSVISIILYYAILEVLIQLLFVIYRVIVKNDPDNR